MNSRWHCVAEVVVVLALTLLIGACNIAAGGRAQEEGGPPQAWIDRPLEGDEYLLDETIPIRWHASSDAGLRAVEALINGDLVDLADDLDPYRLIESREFDWLAPAAGDYLLEVIPEDVDGVAGAAAEKRFRVLEGAVITGAVYSDLNSDGDAQDEGEGPLRSVSVVVVECTEKLSTRTGDDGRFHFEPVPAGDCVMEFVRTGWRVTGSFPPGLDHPFHIHTDSSHHTSFSVYMKQDATPTPTATPTRTPVPFVATAPVLPVTPMVPTLPAPDTQDPPIPVIASPKDGQMLTCLQDVVLRWKAVTDPSGIDVYQVELYVSHDNGGSWDGAGSWSLETTSLNVNQQTDCGLLYLWKVRARDNAGNTGGWAMTTFAIGID